MKRPRVTPIELSEEQEQSFIETWENNRCDTARVILHDKLGLGIEPIGIIAKQLREEGKIRDKRQKRYSEKQALDFKKDYECGMTLREIAEKHNVGIKGVNKYLKELYGGKLPQIKASLDGEIWKDINGCSTHQVSNMGRICVKSTNQIFYGHIYQRYRYISIIDDLGKKHHYAVHRLVAQAFIPNPDNKAEVDHIDGNPANNHVSNLRWVTAEENSNNIHRLKLLSEQAGKRRTDKLIHDSLKTIFDTGLSKLDLIQRILDYKEVSQKE